MIARGKAISGVGRLTQILHDDASRPSLMGDLEPLRRDPSLILRPLNIQADPWQRQVLESDAEKMLLLCSRQTGKSFIMAALALKEALLNPWAEVLIISKTLRQSTELLLKVKMLWRGMTGGRVHRRKTLFTPRSLLEDSLVERQRVEEMGWDGAALIQLDRSVLDGTKDKALSMGLPNGARITSLPGSPDTIVGFSAVTLLIIDEAARVSDALYNLVRPFLAASQAVHGRAGRMVVASTPYGKRGWFYEAWQNCEKARAAWEAGRAADAAGTNGHRGEHQGPGQPQASVAPGDAWPQSQGRGGHGPADPQRAVDVGWDGGGAGEAWLKAHRQDGAEGRPHRPPFQTFRVTAEQCPRITREFLDEERAMIGDRWFRQEYGTEFVDSIDSVFSHDLIESMVKSGSGEKKLWFED
jgi:hypothetical protein